MHYTAKEAWDYYVKALRSYATFEGRARRREFWSFVLVNVVISIALAIVSSIIGAKDILSNLYALAMIIPAIAVGVRRLHDIGKSGWWQFLCLLPIIGTIILIVFNVRDSQPGTNDYGPNPKEGTVPPAAPAGPVVPPAATV